MLLRGKDEPIKGDIAAICNAKLRFLGGVLHPFVNAMLWKKSDNGRGNRLMRGSYSKTHAKCHAAPTMKATPIWPRSGAGDAVSLRRGIDNGQPILRGDRAVQKPDLPSAHCALFTPSSRHNR